MDSEASAFFQGDANALACYDALWQALRGRYPGMETRVQKTQISFYDHGLFCCVSRSRRKADAGAILVTFGLNAPVSDERVYQAVEPYPNRWTHHIIVRAPAEVDAQLLAWIDWAHDFKERTRAK